MNWTSFFLGFAAFPLLMAVVFILLVAINVTARLMKKRGWHIEFKAKRSTDRISNFTLKHNIWFERQRGPIFTGYWYREVGDYAFVNRWLGIGNAEGTNLMIFKSTNLGLINKDGEVNE
jgi:hypothetical protein